MEYSASRISAMMMMMMVLLVSTALGMSTTERVFTRRRGEQPPEYDQQDYVARPLSVPKQHPSSFFNNKGPTTEAARLSAFPEEQRTFARDWIHCLRTWPKSYVLRRIQNPLIFIVAWSASIAVLNPSLAIGTGLHTLVGGALSLLLVFRTNTAYNRFWEGRRVFDRLGSRSRDLADFVGVYRCEIGTERATRIVALLRAFPVALRLHLQGFRYTGVNVESLFDELGAANGEIPLDDFVKMLRRRKDVAAALGVPTDLDEMDSLQQLHWLKFNAKRKGGVTLPELAAYYSPLQLWRTLADAGALNRHAVAVAPNMPLAIAAMLSREAKAVPYDSFFSSRERLWLLSRIASLRATVSAAERICTTPVPIHYARHTSRFLSVWCLTLPLCLVHHLPNFALPPVMAVVSWSLLGLREIGLLIENPFRRSLQLTMLTDALAQDIDDITYLHKLTSCDCDENYPTPRTQQQQQHHHDPPDALLDDDDDFHEDDAADL